MLEDLFEEGRDFAVVGGDDSIGEAGGVELAAGMGGEERGEDPEGGERGCELEVEDFRARRRVGLEVGVDVGGDPKGDQG